MSDVRNYIALVVRENEDGSGEILRVIMVPPRAVRDDELTAMAEYGNQHVLQVQTTVCDTFEEVRAVFDTMNPPASDGKEMACAECGRAMEIGSDGVSHHLTPEGEVDHDADAGHVAVDGEEYDGGVAGLDFDGDEDDNVLGG